MTEADTTLQGQLLEGRYRLLERIAEGGMATMYRASDERLGRTVAIKVMHAGLAQGPQRDQFVERFHREARSAAAIANPHIVQIYDTGEWQGLNFIVMEYVHGVNLRHEMNAHGTFDVRESVRIVSQTLDGLAAAHSAGVVHRDIKPENILLNDRGRVQITDFGLARAVSQATVSTTGMLLGTAAYLAPEIIEENNATPQGDLYAVGIMMWEMLTGAVPFLSDNPVTMLYKHAHEEVPELTGVCPGIDPNISGFVSHLSRRDMSERPQDAAQALDELRQIGAQLDVAAWGFHLAPQQQSDTTASPTSSVSKPTTAQTPLPPVPPTASATSAATDAVTSASATTPASSTQTAEPTVTTAQTETIRSAANDGRGAQKLDTQAITSSPTTAMSTDALTRAQGNDTTPHSTSTLMTPAPAKRHRSKKPWIIALVILLVLALTGGGSGWWYFLGPGSYWKLPKPDDLKCSGGATTCAITDVSWKTYEKTLKVAGIPFEVSHAYSDTVKSGDIISTAPKAPGDRLSKRGNAKLTVTLSRGVRKARVPKDIDDPTSADGKDPMKTLRAAGFTNVIHNESKDEYSEELPEGVLQSISVDPGATLRHNAKITVELSKGPMPVSMPDVVGKPKDEAVSAFADAKLKVKYSEEFSDSVPAGNVISASVQQGTQMHWGDSVDVVISKGPETVTVPDVRGKSTDEAKKTLQDLGLDVKISSPLGDIAHTVRLQSLSPGQQVSVHDKDGNKTVITLTVI